MSLEHLLNMTSRTLALQPFRHDHKTKAGLVPLRSQPPAIFPCVSSFWTRPANPCRTTSDLIVQEGFINYTGEHFGHHVVPLALRNVIAFEANAWLHERLKCFAVQASIATKQHVLKFQRIVPSP